VIDWRREPAHPGDVIGVVAIQRTDEIGLVCAQHYGSLVRIAAFLPGQLVTLPGDTPKTEPERFTYFIAEDRAGAERQFDQYLRDAQDEGWVIPLSTGDRRVTPLT